MTGQEKDWKRRVPGSGKRNVDMEEKLLADITNKEPGLGRLRLHCTVKEVGSWNEKRLTNRRPLFDLRQCSSLTFKMPTKY
jgi:hypothetical protein